MTLVVVLLCLVVQRLFAWEVHKPRFTGIIYYFTRLETWCSAFSWWQSFWGVLLLLGSIAIIYFIIIGLLNLLLGLVFTFLFHSVVLWYYLDAKPISVETAEKMPLTALFMNRYQAIFAILFWYIILGPLGVILYAESCHLEMYLKTQQKTEVYFSEEFLQKLTLIRSLMDWLPLRLLGLTYALVGQFRPVFAYWCNHFIGLQAEPNLVVDYGMVALGWDPNIAVSSSASQVDEIRALITRALMVWLLALALFTLGRWL